MQPLLLFGAAAAADDGLNCIYKIAGCGETSEAYRLVLEVTDGRASFITSFSLAGLIDSVDQEIGIVPTAEAMLEWLKQSYDGQTVEAAVGTTLGGGLQLTAEYKEPGLEEPIQIRHEAPAPLWVLVAQIADGASEAQKVRLPAKAQRPLLPLADPDGATWVLQELLFSQHKHMVAAKRQLLTEAALRTQAEQQLEDCLEFLAASSDGSSALAARSSLAAPQVAHLHCPIKRKEHEPEAGSAVKAARPDEPTAQGGAAAGSRASGAAAAASGAVPAAGAAAASEPQAGAGSMQHSSGTQQTGGLSGQSRRTVAGEAVKLKGRGRGGGIGRRGPAVNPLKIG